MTTSLETQLQPREPQRPPPKGRVRLFGRQGDCFGDASRHQFVLAGRRGGKTVMVCERLLKAIATAPQGARVFYIGPTNQDAYDLVWDELEMRMDQLGWRFKPLISKRRFELSRGRRLYVIGAEKIRRVRGHKAWFMALDEVAFYKVPLKTIWRAVRPALSDLKGRVLMTTTPDGKGTNAYDFYLWICTRPAWKYFYWKTSDNPHISRSEIEDAKQDMDEKSFKQEYEANWESYEGLAYYSFDEALSVKPCADIDPQFPLDLCLDFNVNPTSLLLAQHDFGMARVRKEYSLKNSSTVETVKRFCEEFKDRKDLIFLRVFGDAAGNNRHSTTGFSDYFYLKELLAQYGFRYEMCVPGFNPPIIDRLGHVNSWLKNTYGKTRVEVDPSCVDLIRDLSSQEVVGRIPSDKNNLGHKADAFGYYIYWIHTIGRRKKQGTTQL